MRSSKQRKNGNGFGTKLAKLRDNEKEHDQLMQPLKPPLNTERKGMFANERESEESGNLNTTNQEVACSIHAGCTI